MPIERVLQHTPHEVYEFFPTIFNDDRGLFAEVYAFRDFQKWVPFSFYQTNLSKSNLHTVRGLHYQRYQGKLVRVVEGRIFDVAVCLYGPNCGQWTHAILSAKHQNMLWIPAGFAHGFQALRENTVVEYMVTDYYNPQEEGAIAWDDPILKIDWPFPEAALVSEKDKQAKSWDQFLKSNTWYVQ